jgi:hypothetical protein
LAARASLPLSSVLAQELRMAKQTASDTGRKTLHIAELIAGRIEAA